MMLSAHECSNIDPVGRSQRPISSERAILLVSARAIAGSPSSGCYQLKVFTRYTALNMVLLADTAVRQCGVSKRLQEALSPHDCGYHVAFERSAAWPSRLAQLHSPSAMPRSLKLNRLPIRSSTPCSKLLVSFTSTDDAIPRQSASWGRLHEQALRANQRHLRASCDATLRGA
jgi:hypothetical protein